MERSAVILPAAGSGSRMKLDHPKQFHLLAGVPILVHTIRVFTQSKLIQRVVLVIPPDHRADVSTMLRKFELDQEDIRVIDGGPRRQDSVLNGLMAVGDDIDYVLVHDAARPLLQEELIQRCLQGAQKHGAAIAAIPVKDTLKCEAENGIIDHTVDRSKLWQAQTPQVARRTLLLSAYEQNGEEDVTDEASLLEKAGIPVQLVAGAETNLKITRPEDLVLAEKLLGPAQTSQILIGHGYDAHRFAPDRKLVLGGITVEYELGLAGHSDADVLTHALCDGILGAMGEGDIGKHFPDNDPSLEGIYSITLLEKVIALAASKNLRLGNADITVVCQAPKLAPWLQKMRELLAKTCKSEVERINLKATTTEKMGFTGRKEGIGCHAVVLLQSI